ncbi:carbohydrate kinase family protein [Candidatus Saccharibacteria bacterium]|nr:MAG: carbohydrate kinase family protein [Candidatus Saccharibacteria bacterium]
MAKFLKQLLDAHEPMFSSSLRQLESMTGHRGVDVAYIADITARAHHIMRSIGLDPADTTALELYKALNAHAANRELFSFSDDVGLILEGKPISFNHDDVLENTSQTFELRTNKHLQCQLQHGLAARYVAADGDDEVAINELVSQGGLSACDMGDYHEQKVFEKKSKQAPYILCVGDIFTDVFIKLLEEEASIEKDNDDKQWLRIPFGSKPPYERADIVRSVGPSPNAAVSCARLGLRVGLMSWLGDDQVGKDSLIYLAHESIDTKPLIVQKNTPSSTYYVLRYGADRTILVKNEAYQYRWREPITTPDWIYLSLISPDSWPLHQDLLEYLEKHPDVKLAFQPGTFHFKWGAKKLAALYKRAHIVVMNREEAVDVTGKSYESLRELSDGLHALGPAIVVITDGPNGSYASHDGKLYKIPNYPDPAPPYDRTGAGDAFASTIVAALARGETIETALTWAPINSMSVVQQLGAQAGLLRPKEVEEYIAKAPEWYKAEEIHG